MRDGPGEPIVKGKSVTGFTNGEEAAVNLTHVVPFLVEDELKRIGGLYQKAADWASFAITDGRLVMPDIIPFDPGQPASYPANGRTLTDDVMDVFISTLTNARQTGDGVGPHRDLLTDFPYLGPPHQVR